MRGLVRVARDSFEILRLSQSRRAEFQFFRAEILAVVLLAWGAASSAEPAVDGAPGFRLRPLVTMGLSGGGETIARYRGTFLGEPTEFEVDAGGDVFLFGGVSLDWPRHHTGVLIQGGLFTGGPSNFEQSAEFNRVPLELIAVYEWGRFRGGLGATRHFSPKFRDKGIENIGFDFEDATGAVAQLEYLFDRFNVGLRYVGIDYALRGVRDRPTLDGDHVGITGTYRFGDRGRYR